jgi:hypothetical protein
MPARPVRSEVVPAAADRVTGHPEQREYHAHYQDDDADRPDDGNFDDEPDDEENDSEDDQRGLLDDGPPSQGAAGRYGCGVTWIGLRSLLRRLGKPLAVTGVGEAGA